MGNLWRGVDLTADQAVVPATWRKRLGPDFATVRDVYLRKVDREARTYPCAQGCGCRHEIVRHADGAIVAVCVCEDEDCDHIHLTEEDTVLLEMNLGKLGRAVGAALCGEGRDADLGISGTWQVGAAGHGNVPVVMGLAESDGRFRAMVAELVARLRKPFVLVAPTNRSLDANTQTLLTSGQAEFLDLQSHLTMRADGSLHASDVARAVLSRLESSAAFPLAGTMAPATTRPRFAFRKSGDVWQVVFEGGVEFYLDDTHGARYLDYLLHHPNLPISAFDLEVLVLPEKRTARSRNSIQPGADGEAVRRYLRALEELRAERDEAASSGALGRADRIDEQIEQLTAQLKQQGRSVDTGERARDNVRKAINKVLHKLRMGDKTEHAFGHCIDQCVSLGYEVVFRWSEEVAWA